jgi:acyl carrier protein
LSEAQALEWITEIVREQLHDDHITLSMDTTPEDVEDWDSLAQVRIVVAVEQAIGNQFTVQQIEALQSVGDLVRLVRQINAG